MQLVYNSDSFAVLHFVAPGAVDATAPTQTAGWQDAGGYEIVDKHARKEIYLQGAVAESFQRGVKALVDEGQDPEALENFIAGFTVLAQQPVLLH